jgi:S-adenosylmethionine:tRNA ribosyltransferase-isomerase
LRLGFWGEPGIGSRAFCPATGGRGAALRLARTRAWIVSGSDVFMSQLATDYDYPLPEELIATRPPERREAARMLVLHRFEGRWEHRLFTDFPQYLRAGDLVVLNNTRVIRARVYSDDGRMELLLLEQLSPVRWRSMVKPGRKLRVGSQFVAGGIRATVLEIFEDGERLLEFEHPLDLERIGELPLPPYMGRAPEAADVERYQTVYASEEGSVAAPTAGLHFTCELLERIPHAFLTLHVGSGTFRPVQVERIDEHPMHSERFVLPASTARALEDAARVIAVGTTTTRVLESCAAAGRPLAAASGRTELFIRPPYEFRMVEALLTNFHLPKSTLLMLVSALAGRDLVMAAYEEAVRERYRFYSYGDCMLIL